MRPVDPQIFRQLQVFVAVIDAGSFTAAARTLSLSRSAISLHVQNLEDALGVRLIERTTRRMALTQVGAQVLEAARRMVVASREAVSAAEDAAGQIRGVLRVTCPVGLARILLMPVIARLRAAHPQLRIDARIADSSVDLVREGIDVAVRLGTPSDSSHVMRRLHRMQEVIVATPALVASWAHATTPAELTDAPWIVHSLAQPLPLRFSAPDTDRQSVVACVPALVLTDSQMLIQCAVDGLGFAKIPAIMVADAIRTGQLVRVLPAWQGREVSLYTLEASRGAVPRRQVFIAALQKHADRLTSDSLA